MLFDQEANPLQQSFNRLGWLKFTSLSGMQFPGLYLIVSCNDELSNLPSKVKLKIKL